MPIPTPLSDGVTGKEPAYDALREQLLNLNRSDDNRFLKIGRQLRIFWDALPPGKKKLQALGKLLKGSNIHHRRAMYWIEIDRIYSSHVVPRERLARIGWSKLIIMAKQINSQNLDDWLALAEKSTTHELRARVRGAAPAKHQIVFKLSAAQNTILTAALTSAGARRLNGRTLGNKEAALIEVCRRSMTTPKDLSSRENSVTQAPVDVGEADDDSCWTSTR